ncbi:MAG TPA: hypothetical protein VGL47_08185 [Amycolatopsis sp.]|uniref:Uncharacterized protein n=1 Tax=Amycolatopsis nalaikhensis TaxID=715472 RepID=A0ABY8XL37_9PSEU|nr:hypothetical protein [Amycolatopsis sp. 2-2]WIV56343.1 hypothetical protein QP939_47385 [Amycolatopsis sp. 2-2]
MTIVFAAALATLALVLIPARHRYWRLAAVLGWTTVWLDGHAGLDPLDLTGLGVAVGSLVVVLVRQRRATPEES